MKTITLGLAGLLLATNLSAQDFTISPDLVQVPEAIAKTHVTPKFVARSILPQSNGLKAVLLVGPIDGDTGSWTTSEIKNMQAAAQELRAYGVKVEEFYTPNNDWTAIKKAAEGANFLFYRGHGVYDGTVPPQWVGGFSLKNKFASSADIKTDLKLAKGAVIMLYGCFTAGNSGFDIGKIDQPEAQRRVAMYAKPFFEMGAGAYYADWFGDAFPLLVKYLFSGKSLGDAYKAYSDFGPKTVNYGSFPPNPALQMWVDHDVWDGKTAYNYAFVGNPSQTLPELVKLNATGIAETPPADASSDSALAAIQDAVNSQPQPDPVRPSNQTATAAANSASTSPRDSELTFKKGDKIEVRVANKTGQARVFLDKKLVSENEFSSMTDWVSLPAKLSLAAHSLTFEAATDNKKKDLAYTFQVRINGTVIWELTAGAPDQGQRSLRLTKDLKPAP